MRISKYLLTVVWLLIPFIAGCKKEEETITPVNNDPVTNDIILNEPANNSTVNIFTPLLKWQQYQSSSSYFVQLSTDANFITPLLLDSAVSTIEAAVPDGKLTTNIYYYWRVKADLGSGNFSNWSPVYRFRVIESPPLPPVLLLPPHNSVNQSFLPFFDWEESLNADFYRFQLSVSPSFSPVLLDSTNLQVTSLQAPYFYILTGTNYYWRVNAANSNGTSIGDWSQVFTFRTVDGPQPSTISGRVRFTDNNFVEFPFFYVIGAFKTNNWPPGQEYPDYTDSLDIKFVNNEYVADYRIAGITNGDYYLAVYTASTQIFSFRYKSVYGCDTSRVIYSNCPLTNPGTVSINNGNGVNNINMLSWADSSKSIF